ncbi:rrg1 [Candida pseudojiufengensis]|uniref:rrg1 n=1 Tax=Candida pseudojiufengensis TaxID=497109 RepID=UPI002224AD16|nr:rrg1 [Candida pseudojiufengensis]KAI5960188.1 rrg1 [Candida pseudojiufengensis]
MDFDPLSFISSTKSHFNDDDDMTIAVSELMMEKNENQKTILKVLEDEGDEEDDDHLIPLHILDLPLLKLKPNFATLSVILKLLSPDEVLNFQQNNHKEDLIKEEEIWNSKDITTSELKEALPWLIQYCPRFNSPKKLSHLPQLSYPLKLQYNDYNAYLTRIISNELSWLPSQKEIEIIHNLTSLRISENCGRMAQPEIIRKISLKNLEVKTGYKFIRLKEPSMTNDNLGLKTWGSSLILSQRLLNYSELIPTGKKILELGSGTGLVGIILNLLNYKTYLTDLPEILSNLKTNIEINNLVDIECHALDWSKPDDSTLFGTKFEIIVVSDPIYSSNHPQWLMNAINTYLLDSSTSIVLIEIPLRPNFENERQKLWDLFHLNNFKEIEMEIEDGFDDFGEMKFCYKKFQKMSM